MPWSRDLNKRESGYGRDMTRRYGQAHSGGDCAIVRLLEKDYVTSEEDTRGMINLTTGYANDIPYNRLAYLCDCVRIQLVLFARWRESSLPSYRILTH